MSDLRNRDYYEKLGEKPTDHQGEMTGGSMRKRIEDKCDEIKELLVDKNLKYGNSAISPLRIFSKAEPAEGLLVRCDDKLSRIRSTGINESGEDQVTDLIGYLVLISIHRDLGNI